MAKQIQPTPSHVDARRSRAPLKVAFVSEGLLGTPAEGSRRTAFELATRLGASVDDFLAIGPPGAPEGVRPLLSGSVPGLEALRVIRGFGPDRIVFCPYYGLSRGGWIRLGLLAASAPRARLVVVLMQPFAPSRLARSAARVLRNRLVVLAASPACSESARAVGLETVDAVLGVDTDVFSPVDDATRRGLRQQHGFAADDRIVLHVGHATRGRGLERIARLADAGYEVVFALSSDTQWGSNRFVPKGERIRSYVEYREDIADFYRMADVYAFCVEDAPLSDREHARSAIGTPLSVLEALACGTPVVTTPFGRLTELLAGRPDVAFIDNEDLGPAVGKLFGTRSSGSVPGWDQLVNEVLEA